MSGTPISLLRLPSVLSTASAPARASADRRDQLLRRRLAVRAGDRDDLRSRHRARDARAPSCAERAQRVVDLDRRRRDRRASAAPRPRSTTTPRAPRRDRAARRSRGRRSARPGARRRARPRAPRGCRSRRDANARAGAPRTSSPPVAAARVDARMATCAMASTLTVRRADATFASAARASSRSSKWMLGRADDLVVLVALAGDEHDVARRAPPRSPPRSPRRRSTLDDEAARRARSRTPSTIMSRIARGSSVRGLSLVTIGEVGVARRPRAPIFGRLVGSRSPPQPNTHDQPPARQRPQRRQHPLERVGRVRVVDEDADAASFVDALEPPRHAAHAAERRARSPRAASPSADADADGERQVLHVVVRRRAASAARSAPTGVANSRVDAVDRLRRRASPRTSARAARRRHAQRAPARRAQPCASPYSSSMLTTATPSSVEVLAEQPRLGVAVRLHRAVEIEVVLRQVGERRDAKAHAVEPPERERVRASPPSPRGCTPAARISASVACSTSGVGVVYGAGRADVAEAIGRPCRSRPARRRRRAPAPRRGTSSSSCRWCR